MQRCAVEPVTPGYLKNDFFSAELSLSLSRASHLRTLFSWRGFHGPTSRYGNRAAAGDRKLISALSELAMQPGICHLGMTKIQPGSGLSGVQINESGSTEAWALSVTCGRYDGYRFCKKKKRKKERKKESPWQPWASSPSAWMSLFSGQEAANSAGDRKVLDGWVSF